MFLPTGENLLFEAWFIFPQQRMFSLLAGILVQMFGAGQVP